jgi:Antitoxin SocA-like, Panacea domain
VKLNATSSLTPKDKRLRELAIYISDKSSGDESFGATKLNKLLFYSDFLAYLNFGEPITGSDYFKLPNGPAPKRWLPIKESMVEQGDAKIKEEEFYGFPQQKLIPLRPANLKDFKAESLTLVDKIIALHKGKTAAEISNESHGFVGWQLACNKEVIPYQVARVSRRPLSDKELKHGKGLDTFASSVLEQKAC